MSKDSLEVISTDKFKIILTKNWSELFISCICIAHLDIYYGVGQGGVQVSAESATVLHVCLQCT